MVAKRSGIILVVDDHKNWRELLATILETDGHQVRVAGNFQEAQALLKAHDFEIAIFDMRLMDSVYDVQGMLLLKEAKRLHPSIKAIILTGYPDTTQRAKALDFYGAVHYLEKAPDGQPSFDIDVFSQLMFDLLGESA